VLDLAQRAGALRPELPTRYLGLLLFSLTNRTMLWYRPNGPLRPAQLGELFAVLFLAGAAAPDATRQPRAAGR